MSFCKSFKNIFFIALVACFLTSKTWANDEKVLVKKINFNAQNQLEIFLTKKTEYRAFILKEPNRLVIDIVGADFEKIDQKNSFPDFVLGFRHKKNENSLRIVFDLNQKVSLEKTNFEKLPKENLAKISIVISKIKKVDKALNLKSQEGLDFIGQKAEEFSKDFKVETTKVNNPDGSAKYIVRKIPKNLESNSVLHKIPVIVIDSGHGGKDPGTIGIFARSKEKNITLSYAKELAKQLSNTGKYQVYLTREDDRFISLRKRVEIARRKKADLFISLHVNAISDESVTGFSIYTLSEKSSDKQAEILAQKENRADIIDGVNFSGASEDIMKTLIDLSQRETMNGSSRFAGMAVKSIQNSEINILQNTHRFAGFAVLTAPDMISVLIELGYLSNKYEEKLLNSISYKRKVAESLVKAIDEYFVKNKT